MRQALVALLLTGAGLLACPPAADAQTAAARSRVAYLIGDATCDASPSLKPFAEGMRALGYAKGVNFEIACRSAEGKYERLNALAEELVRTKPAVIVASAVPASLAAKRATSTIPIVSVYTADPVGVGLVQSLRRPGGNVTGVSALAADYAAKSLQLLKEAAPRISRVGVLGDRRNPTFDIYRRQIEPAGQTLGLALDFAPVETVQEIEAALAALQGRGADAILVMHQPFTYVNGPLIAEFATRHRLPSMYGVPDAVDSGGLMSYAVNVPEVFRRAASYVDKILKGAKPADLPVEQPTKFELVINLKTSKALGLTLPPALLLRADRVID